MEYKAIGRPTPILDGAGDNDLYKYTSPVLLGAEVAKMVGYAETAVSILPPCGIHLSSLTTMAKQHSPLPCLKLSAIGVSRCKLSLQIHKLEMP